MGTTVHMLSELNEIDTMLQDQLQRENRPTVLVRVALGIAEKCVRQPEVRTTALRQDCRARPKQNVLHTAGTVTDLPFTARYESETVQCFIRMQHLSDRDTQALHENRVPL